ncbi:MAG: response regulator [Phototrophicaceae bacterium]
MIAEDETDIRNLVVTMAGVWGHSTLAFESGTKAWEFLDAVNEGSFDGDLPQFALMDIRMPGPRGDEIAQRIRQTPAISNIPIVLMTAFALSDDEMRTMRAETGVDFIINKPLPDFMQLKNILETIIANKA